MSTTTNRPAIRPDIKYKRVSHARYWDMLEVLWPACNMDKPYGFLVGEPWDHGECTVTHSIRPRYSVFLNNGKPDGDPQARYFEGDKPMSLPEFHKLGDNGRADVRLITGWQGA